MALIQCSECGQMVSEQAAACPHCGVPAYSPTQQPPVQPQPQKKGGFGILWLVLGGIAAVLLLVGGIVGALIYNANQPSELPMTICKEFEDKGIATNCEQSGSSLPVRENGLVTFLVPCTSGSNKGTAAFAVAIMDFKSGSTRDVNKLSALVAAQDVSAKTMGLSRADIIRLKLDPLIEAPAVVPWIVTISPVEKWAYEECKPDTKPILDRINHM